MTSLGVDQIAFRFLLKSSLICDHMRFSVIAPPMTKKPSTISLQEIPEGEDVRVVSLEGAEELGTRLRELGFCEQAVVRRVSGGSHVVCQVCGSKVALNGSVAGSIRVERFNCEG